MHQKRQAINSLNASYIAGKCEGVGITINNTNKNVLVSL